MSADSQKNIHPNISHISHYDHDVWCRVLENDLYASSSDYKLYHTPLGKIKISALTFYYFVEAQKLLSEMNDQFALNYTVKIIEVMEDEQCGDFFKILSELCLENKRSLCYTLVVSEDKVEMVTERLDKICNNEVLDMLRVVTCTHMDMYNLYDYKIESQSASIQLNVRSTYTYRLHSAENKTD